jgi:hypothetical protein
MKKVLVAKWIIPLSHLRNKDNFSPFVFNYMKFICYMGIIK